MIQIIQYHVIKTNYLQIQMESELKKGETEKTAKTGENFTNILFGE
jgi:hypothetical protein